MLYTATNCSAWLAHTLHECCCFNMLFLFKHLGFILLVGANFYVKTCFYEVWIIFYEGSLSLKTIMHTVHCFFIDVIYMKNFTVADWTCLDNFLPPGFHHCLNRLNVNWILSWFWLFLIMKDNISFVKYIIK